MKNNIWKVLFLLTAIMVLYGCSNNKEKDLDALNSKIEDLNRLLNYIEVNYADTMQDTLRKRERIVFVDCKKKGNLSKDYICDCEDVIKKMKDIGISEIRFENVKVDCETSKQYSEVYFQKKKLFYYPVVYYLFEYCETKSPIETNTIYYKPVDKHWSLYIDSNFP